MPSDAPASITVTEDGATDFTIVRRWHGTQRVFGLNQAVFVLAMSAVVSVLASLTAVSTGRDSKAWPLFVAVALLLYVALLRFIDRTTISVREHVLSVEHGPLPWLRSRRVPTEEIATIGTVFGRVRAVLRDGTDLTLLAYPRWADIGVDEATFIAEELERRIHGSAQAGPT